NQIGVAMGYNFVNRVGSADGFLCNMIGRIILETCATVQEAIDLLKEIPHRTTFSYVLTDLSGETYVVEASARRVVARKSNISTNHFEVLTEENRYRTQESIQRQQAIEQQNSDDLDLIKAYQLLNNRDQAIFSEKYDVFVCMINSAEYYTHETKLLFEL